jgi:hypothetical protein
MSRAFLANAVHDLEMESGTMGKIEEMRPVC